MASFKYENDTTSRQQAERCPICQFPLYNGFQLVCEPGICMYRETPLKYKASALPQTALHLVQLERQNAA